MFVLMQYGVIENSIRIEKLSMNLFEIQQLRLLARYGYAFKKINQFKDKAPDLIFNINCVSNKSENITSKQTFSDYLYLFFNDVLV